MQATALSSTIRAILLTITTSPIADKTLVVPLPTRVSNKWPAIILAVRRTVNVIGRITDLINSIITSAGRRAAGAPDGTKCLAHDSGCLKILSIM